MQLRTRSCSTSARQSTAACCSPRTTTRCAPSLAPRPAWRWATWRRWCGRPLSTLRQLAAAAATTSSPSCTSCKKGPARAATACRCASASAPDPPRLTVGMCTPASTFIAMHHLSHYGMPSWQWKCPCVHFFFFAGGAPGWHPCACGGCSREGWGQGGASPAGGSSCPCSKSILAQAMPLT